MDVGFIIKALSLDKICFFDLKRLILDLQNESRINKDYFFIEFRDAIERELYKKRLFKSKYYNFIIDNKNTLVQLKNNDLLADIYIYLTFSKEKKLFEMIDYLYKNYEYKDLMLENLYKLKLLRLNEFNFVSKLDESVEVFEEKIDYYELNSAYTDGKQNWYKSKKGYLIRLQNHNFIIKYRKNEQKGVTKIELFLKSLVFDSKYIPNYDELYSLNKWQFIDKDMIEKKDKLINDISCLEKDSDKLVKLYDKLVIDVEKLNLNDTICKDVLIKINDNLELISLLEQLKLLLFEQHEDIISIEEFNKVKKL